jgi:hypothetical protein
MFRLHDYSSLKTSNEDSNLDAIIVIVDYIAFEMCLVTVGGE